jgi:hypothetical protein
MYSLQGGGDDNTSLSTGEIVEVTDVSPHFPLACIICLTTLPLGRAVRNQE